MRHERAFSLRIICDACEGEGTVQAGILGPNDPEVIEFVCPVCEGACDVPIEETEIDEDEDME